MVETPQPALLLAPGRFADSDHPEVIAFARAVCAVAASARRD